MKIVVTGALGHIGSRLVRELPTLFPGIEIIMIDNLSTQRYPALFGLPDVGRYRFIEADVTEFEMRPVIEGATVVIHLAAIVDATKSHENRELVERVNFTATRRVAEACALVGAPMVMASTTSVYGTQEKRVDEFCSPSELRPQSPYAEIKLREEDLIRELVKSAALRAIVCRFGTIFGTSTGMRFHTAVNKFCWQAVMEHPITVWKTAYDQKRPYLDLADAVRAIAFIIEHDLFDGDVYNVVTQNATVREIVKYICSHVPDLQVEFVETRIMNQLSYEVANTRLSAAGFEPMGDLAQGIADTIVLLRAANSACLH